MATSGSVDFTLDRDTLIRTSFELLGIAVEGEDLDTDDITVASRALNLMVKAWIAHGLHLWKRDAVSVPLVASQNTYTLGRSGSPDVTTDRPLRIIEADRVDGDGNSVSMTRLSLNEYEELPNKTSEGLPTQYFFEPTLDNSTIKFWVTPDTIAAADYTVELVVQSPLEDMDATDDNFDFPQEWLEALSYNLAYRLAPRYGFPLDKLQFLRADASATLELAKSFDIEEGSVYFGANKEGWN